MRKTIFKKLEAKGLIANYNRFRKNLPSKLPDRVFICDETLSKGIQAPTAYLTYVEKVKLAKMIDETGAFIINVGYPTISEEEKNDVRRIVNESFKQARLAAIAGINKNDIDACIQCGIKEIQITTPFNELNLQHRLKKRRNEVLKNTPESIEYAKKHGATVDFVLEDASRTPLEEIVQIFKAAIDAKADRLVIEDTVGFLRPLSMRYLISRVSESLSQQARREIPLAVRCYDDFGLATANTLAAVEEGVSYVHTSLVGFGERAGMAAFEEVVVALELLYNIDTGVEMKKLFRLAQLAEKSFALPIQAHKSIVGENAFSYEVEEHIRGILAEPMTYESFPPEIIERTPTFHFGRLVGRELVESRLASAGIKATPRQIDDIVRRITGLQESLDKGGTQMTFYQIKKLTKELKKGLTEEDFWRIVEQITRQKPEFSTTQ